MALSPGTRLGPYEILAAAGSGGMGEVYRARDTRLDRIVAVKVLLEAVLQDPGRRQRLEREARAVSSLSHPNICTLHDVGHQDGVDYLVMEFLEGETLDDRLAKGPLPPEQALRHAVEIASALDAAHRRGIVHRDLKPGNIMVDRSGHPILMDFGLAFHQGTDRLTGAGSVLGTLAYLSPEQARGRTTDHRSDLYGVGLILFEMLTGKHPPGDESSVPLALREAAERCPGPSRLVSDVPAALDAIVLRCLEREPERRFPSAADLETALGGAAAGLSSSSASAPRHRSRPLQLARASNARSVTAAAACVLALAAIWLWRSAASFAPKASALCLSTMLASPYGYDYDMMIFAPAIAFLASDGLTQGWRPWEKTLLAAFWLMPISARGIALATFIPLGVIAMIAVYVALLRRGAMQLSKQAHRPAAATS